MPSAEVDFYLGMSPGDGFRPLLSSPVGLDFLMRTVALVVALVACVHAGLWTLLRQTQDAPDFRGHLASVSYSPYARAQHPEQR